MKYVPYLLLLLLVGCSQSIDANKETVIKEHRTYDNFKIALWVDPETKCEYIGGSSSSALTPRLDRNGKHICR